MIELTKEEFLQKIAENKKSVVLFGACAWCSNCRMAKKKLEDIDGQFPEIEFYEIDLDKHIDVADGHKVNQLPTLIAFKGNKEISRWTDEVGDLVGWLNMLTW